jgi:hypothetical protein
VRGTVQRVTYAGSRVVNRADGPYDHTFSLLLDRGHYLVFDDATRS